MNKNKKPFVILDINQDNAKLHYSYSRIEAIEFAQQYYQQHDVFVNDVDVYKASFVLKLEEV